MMMQIDLNCDMGESYGNYVSGQDEFIMPYISSCNIACGFHSGDPVTITKTIELALRNDVAVGAHPSYPDLQGFGRRVMNLTEEEIESCVLYQVSALKGMTESLGGKLHHVKPHGALYNQASTDESTANAIVEAILKVDLNLILYAPDKSTLAVIARKKGLKVRGEVFADRCYEDDLCLRSRTLDGAVLHKRDEVLAQLDLMIRKGAVKTFGGKEISITVQTICLHSDTSGSAELAKEIHDFLISQNVEITSD
ncbi:MAG: 5-oxoprolinase subunit PxpA [Balneolaceae bacterium]